MPWIIGGAAIGSGLIGANSASKAGKEQDATSRAAIEQNRSQYTQNRMDTAPYREAGSDAVTRIAEMLGLRPAAPGQLTQEQMAQLGPEPQLQPFFDRYIQEHTDKFGFAPGAGSEGYQNAQQWAQDAYDKALGDWRTRAGQLTGAANAAPFSAGPAAPFNQQFTEADFENDPVNKIGFKYGLDLGTQAINRGAGASGMLNSGATLKALTRFGQDYAGSKANESYGRFHADRDRLFNRLSGVAGTGQTATMGTAALGGQNAMNIGNILTAQGNARGASAIGQGNAIGGALNTIGNYYGQQQALDKILGSRTGVPNSGMYFG